MIRLKTTIPGPKSSRILSMLEKHNGSTAVPYPFVFSRKGEGAYCEDIDGNRFLDFSSLVASNPLGYNHPDLLPVVRDLTSSPVKFAGQDFCTREHLYLLTELLSISPKEMNAAFFINSGAEAVENALKICLHSRPQAKFGISFENAFHGRTLGALSCTNSKAIHKEGYPRYPMLRLPYDESALPALERILAQEAAPEEIGFIIIECVQGEGGYAIAPKDLVKDLRIFTQEHAIPLICDEVQSGMGRTGKWWAFQHFDITPDVFTSAKALQTAAVVSTHERFPKEPGAISSTWGGGHTLDLAVGLKTIQIIKKQRLLERNRTMGAYLLKGLRSLPLENPRGLGLMVAADLESSRLRDNVIIECMKRGLILLGAGETTIRFIPPYVIEKKDIDAALRVLEKALATCSKKGFNHTGKICRYMDCGANLS